ncbi:MAG: carbamoyltransferase HypF [Desulfobacteraceae bacterium]|nr:carbamoyltransferase HypF [Desulfobacteraceae bacterium]
MNLRPPSSGHAIVAQRAQISGIVQGVGFRPFVHRLAHQFQLHGWVNNTAAGVTIEVEGPAQSVEAFFKALPAQKPPLAHITAIQIQDCPVTGYEAFTIEHSQAAPSRTALISPDVAICHDCLRELFDPDDRRFHYPFINCTNCGPRYTIIDDIPYDRPNTAMAGFTMCALCQAEYDDPVDRRYHAQPNACAECGPSVALYDARRRPLTNGDAIAQAAQLLQAGHILAVKGLGGFHLAVDAFNDDAVTRLRQRKHREEKPLAVMAPDLETIRTFAHVGQEEAQLLATIQRPIVLLPKLLPEKLAFAVAPRNHYYGVMLPYTPLHFLLMAHGFVALVMTSANLSEEPIAIDNDEAFTRLDQIADYFLIHNRPIRLRSDDSIARTVAGRTRLVRRSRGFVPVPVFLKEELPMVLACGAELKNTLCLTKGNQAFVSQHIGDLENQATEEFFLLTRTHLQRILDITPQAVACDLHPDYLNTRWARESSGLPVIQVQHHHAHIAACMAEHQIDGPVIGLAFDGTGFGPDHTVWGSEVLKADLANFERLAHIEQVAMPGSAAAIKEPWRMGLAWLHQAFGLDLWDLALPFINDTSRDKASVILQMIEKHINAPLTSSLGRLFDAVAAIIGLRRDVAFEGQAAMELEMMADGQAQGSYAYAWSKEPVARIQAAPIIRAVVDDLLHGVPAFIISRRFHDTLAALFADLCGQIRAQTGLTRVVLSGGCFQNALLLTGLTGALQQQGFDVYSHALVPTNDGGISLGQAVIAGRILKKGALPPA